MTSSAYLALALTFVCAWLCAPARTDPDRTRQTLDVVTDRLQTTGGTWVLRAEPADVTYAQGRPGICVRYSVRLDDRFVHPDEGGGRLLGCRDSRQSQPALHVDRLAQPGRGWVLSVEAGCGANGRFSRCAVIAVDAGSPTRSPSYHETQFESSWEPRTRTVENHVEIWGAHQAHGIRGGNSSSIYVPFCFRLAPDGRLDRLTLQADCRSWLVPEGTTVGFLPAFIAGLREESPDLMERAMRDLFTPDAATWAAEWWGLPAERAGYEDLVHDVRSVCAARDALRARIPAVSLTDPIRMR